MSSILRERRPNHREYSDYFDAVALAFSANVFILLLFAQMDTSGRAALSETWYWSFVPAMTAAATVWHLDAFAFNRLVPAKGLFAQGLATAAMALFIAFIDKEYRGAGNEELIVFAAYLAIVTFCIGGGLGYWFPRLYLQQMIYHRQHPERRRNRRVPKELEGTWRTVGKAVPVHTLDISRCGCRVKEDLGSHTGTVGRIAFANKWECTARIARTSDDDTAIEFLPDEAWRWFEHQIYKAA